MALLTGWSRAEVQVLIEDGDVQVDGRSVIKSRKLEEGEVVDLLAEPAAVGLPEPQDIPIVVVHEDDDVIVIDKPAGHHRASRRGPPDGTLVNGLLHRYPEIAGVGDPARPGIVHRLDANTSGLLAVARTPAAYEALVAALAARDRRPRVPRARLGRTRRGQRRDRRADRPFRPAADAHGGAGRRPRRAHVLRGGAHVRGPARQPAALHARDRPHAPDPCARRRDQAPGRR